MTRERELLFESAMQLPPEQRAQLAALLIDSIGSADIESIERAWAKEAQRRLAEIKSGAVETIPTEEVEREAEALIDRFSSPKTAVG